MPDDFRKIHGMVQIPDGQKIGDLIDAFSGVKGEISIGDPNTECAGCRKPFNQLRKRRKKMRLYPIGAKIPVAISVDICGSCMADFRKGGAAKQALLASVEAYCEGVEAKQ